MRTMLDPAGCFVARVWNPAVEGPALCHLRDGQLFDVSCPAAPTVRDLLEMQAPAEWVASAPGTSLGTLHEIEQNSCESPNTSKPYFLSPCDLQAIKACGVTFASSMLERVIEEQAGGDPSKAQALRQHCTDIIGDSLSQVKPGSAQSEKLKATLIAEGLWSQYLEVGIGPDAEVFSKSQAMSAVGWGASVGLHPVSTWNNPEPEVVLAVNSKGIVQGACLGNDVNLRDVEGRSALLLGKAKDNNASCSLGPAIRLFDASYSIDSVRSAELTLTVVGEDDYVLEGASSMSEISRDPLELVAQVHGEHHQYPDGFMLMCGTLFAPTQDRDIEGGGFTHKLGDRVTIANVELGSLSNTVRLSTQCPPWTYGVSHLMRNLAKRALI